jgi:hypothetical protein
MTVLEPPPGLGTELIRQSFPIGEEFGFQLRRFLATCSSLLVLQMSSLLDNPLRSVLRHAAIYNPIQEPENLGRVQFPLACFQIVFTPPGSVMGASCADRLGFGG